MNIVQVLCLGLGIIGVILASLPEPENEERLFRFFLFSMVICAIIFFGDLIMKAQS